LRRAGARPARRATDMKEMGPMAPASSASALARQRLNMALFLGPAVLLLFLFFIAPVVVDIFVAFTDMGRTLKITELTTANVERMLTRDRRVGSTLVLTGIYVLGTLAIFNVTFGLILALVTTAVPDKVGGFFRAVWLLPRMSPSVVYALLWAWAIDPNPRGLLNQVVSVGLGFEPIDMMSNHPVILIIIANGFIGASMGMIIFTSAIRAIPEHLFHAARADGAGPLAITWHVTLPAIRWPLSFITVYQTLSLLVSFEYIWLITDGGPFYDSTVYALYVYKRAFENGQYAYGAMLALVLVVIGIAAAMSMWRFLDMERLLQQPRIEVH
jgi:inositol-phosphate transport system permease protein